MLNKWWLMKRALYCRDPDEPPPLIEDCNSLKECYRWRETIMKEIGDKVAEIQNAGLGDFRIRALNDEINKLLNHKRMWEGRIRELGGPDFRKNEEKAENEEGVELPESGGYKYFGAAKDLPGVREIFFKETALPPSKNLRQLQEKLDNEYYIGPEIEERLWKECERKDEEKKQIKLKEWIQKHYSKIVKKYSEFQKLDQNQIKRIL